MESRDFFFNIVCSKKNPVNSIIFCKKQKLFWIKIVGCQYHKHTHTLTHTRQHKNNDIHKYLSIRKLYLSQNAIYSFHYNKTCLRNAQKIPSTIFITFYFCVAYNQKRIILMNKFSFACLQNFTYFYIPTNSQARAHVIVNNNKNLIKIENTMGRR